MCCKDVKYGPNDDDFFVHTAHNVNNIDTHLSSLSVAILSQPVLSAYRDLNT
jgi:hypothetical protein